MTTCTYLLLLQPNNNFLIISSEKCKTGAEQTRTSTEVSGKIRCHEKITKHPLLTSQNCCALFFVMGKEKSVDNSVYNIGPTYFPQSYCGVQVKFDLRKTFKTILVWFWNFTTDISVCNMHINPIWNDENTIILDLFLNSPCICVLNMHC